MFAIVLVYSCGSKRALDDANNPTVLKDQKPSLYKDCWSLEDGIYAEIQTTKGLLVCALEYTKAPITVANFVGLTEGDIPNEARSLGEPYFDKLVFHRVVPNVLIQTGDPSGNGTGGPGYSFSNEFHDSLKHDRAGILSMANSGNGSNGSQFFITQKAMPYFDYKHTVFGRVVVGLDVLSKIKEGDKLITVQIYRKGDEALSYSASCIPFTSLIKKN